MSRIFDFYGGFEPRNSKGEAKLLLNGICCSIGYAGPLALSRQWATLALAETVGGRLTGPLVRAENITIFAVRRKNDTAGRSFAIAESASVPFVIPLRYDRSPLSRGAPVSSKDALTKTEKALT